MMNRRNFLRFASGCLASSMLPMRSAKADGRPLDVARDRPNFIIIFTDDQGYQDVGCFGSPLIRTPNLDKMARDGMRFTDFYSAASVCSPSRAALLTGCYPPRVGITGVLFPRNSIGLNPKDVTIADLLKKKGYSTACIGKWHLGHLKPFLPRNHGFDYYYGIPYSNDMTIDQKADIADDAVLRDGWTRERIKSEKPRKNLVPLMRNGEIVEYPCDQRLLTKKYTAEALSFIEDNKDNPFFLYLPHTMPHIPLFASENFKGKSPRGLYGDVIEEIDDSVGRIFAKLEKLGIDDNTFVVYTSDNGPWLSMKKNGGCALPLRDGKFTTYEGGMREPTIMKWPGMIPAGRECSEVCGTIDLLPTIAKLASAKVPDGHIIDGKDISPLMFGKPGAGSPHDAYFYYKGRSLQAVRAGEWKLRITRGRGQKKPTVELYNLRDDISEKNNRAKDRPAIVRKLKKVMDDFDADLKANVRPAGRVET